MQTKQHDRARALLDREIAKEQLAADDDRWLNRHLSECDECSQYAAVLHRTVRALDSFAFDLNAEAALRVQQAVRGRAMELAAAGRVSSVAVPVAVLLTVLGSIAAWTVIERMAGLWNWPSSRWQIGFALLWLLPSILLDLVIVFRGNWIGVVDGKEVIDADR